MFAGLCSSSRTERVLDKILNGLGFPFFDEEEAELVCGRSREDDKVDDDANASPTGFLCNDLSPPFSSYRSHVSAQGIYDTKATIIIPFLLDSWEGRLLDNCGSSVSWARSCSVCSRDADLEAL